MAMARLLDKILPVSPPPNPLRLKCGDIVKLKSGGPDMTVIRLNLRGYIFCQWFESGKLHCARFLPSNVITKKR